MYLFWVKLETDAFLRVNNTFCVLLLWKTMIKFLRQHNPNTYQTLLFWVGHVILDVVLRQAVKYTMMSSWSPQEPTITPKHTHAHVYRQTVKDQPYTAKSSGISQHGVRWEKDEGSAFESLWTSQTEKEMLSIRTGQMPTIPLPPSLSFSFSLNSNDLSDLGKQFNDHC